MGKEEYYIVATYSQRPLQINLMSGSENNACFIFAISGVMDKHKEKLKPLP